MTPSRVLVAEASEADGQTLTSALRRHGHEAVAAPDRAALPRLLATLAPDVVIVGGASGGAADELDVALAIRAGDTAIGIAVIVRESSEDRAIAALRAGVDDYLRHPVTVEQLLASVARMLRQVAARARGRTPVAPPGRAGAPPGRAGAPRRGADVEAALVGSSAAMRELRDELAKIAATDSNVLITGETGTGKDLVARLIHDTSARAPRPFVPINCAAIPDTLLESELFGHERGAFTGADAARDGALLAARGGTAFFDEIGDMSLYGQAKILRAIEAREVQRLGGRAPVGLDVRVIAATNQDVERAMAERKFRSDLYFRLNVARIHLAPLRDRKDDLPLLVEHYLGELNRRFGRDVEQFTDEAQVRLFAHDWPGNVRELRNVLEASFVDLGPRCPRSIDLPARVRAALGTDGVPADERARLLSALSASNWNKSRAAERLQWSRMTLYRKMAKYALVESGKPLAHAPPRTSRVPAPPARDTDVTA